MSNIFSIVSDRYKPIINVFDRDGNFPYEFGKKWEGDREFNTPRFLSVNKAGHPMVSDTWSQAHGAIHK